MRRGLALLWLGVVAVVAALQAAAWLRDVEVRGELLALFPVETRDPRKTAALNDLNASVAGRIALLIGNGTRELARADAVRARDRLLASPAVSSATLSGVVDADAVLQLYRAKGGGLLSDADRTLLASGGGARLVDRAAGQILGGFGIIDSDWLKDDPFVLLPSFLQSLPRSFGATELDDGMLTVREDGTYWIVLVAKLSGDAMTLDVQKSVVEAVRAIESASSAGTRVLKSGAVFFAEAGSRVALQETSTFGTISTIAVVLLLIAAFRSVGPLLHNLISVSVGILFGLAAVVLVFGNIHVFTFLLGTSVIGIAIDYGIHYCAQCYSAEPDPARRLARIFPGLLLGFVTTIAGYALFLLSALPGLSQLAVFMVVGLTAAFVTVVLWFPALDRQRSRPLPAALDAVTRAIDRLARSNGARWGGLIALVLLSLYGAAQVRVSDDVRTLQSLDAALVREQRDIQRLAGVQFAGQMLAIDTADDEAALQLQEMLIPRLDELVRQDRLVEWQAPARWVPSSSRQQADASLVDAALVKPFWTMLARRIGLEGPELSPRAARLTLEDLRAVGLLEDLVRGPGRHAVLLMGLVDPQDGRRLAELDPRILFVDAAGEVSSVLALYRERAELLVAAAWIATLVLLIWRYGWRGGVRVVLPTTVAMAVAPLIAAVFAVQLNLFGILALILVLSIGIDYSIFVREGPPSERHVTMASVLLDALTTLLAFGLLGLSSAEAVRGFGLTMLFGIAIATILAPLAARPGRAAR